MALTNVQSLGIGIAIGFLAALVPVMVFAYIHRRSLPIPTRITPVALPDYETCLRYRPQYGRHWADDGTWGDWIIDQQPLEGPGFEEVVGIDYAIDHWVEDYVHALQYEPRLFHVEMRSVLESVFDEDELVALAGPPPRETWAALLTAKKTRLMALKKLLALAIFKMIDPCGPPEESLLPPEVVACYRYLVAEGSNVWFKEILFKWREMTFMLLEHRFSIQYTRFRGLSSVDPRNKRISDVTEKLFRVLRIRDLINIGRRRDIEIEDPCLCAQRRLFWVVASGANMGFNLFSSGHETWEAVWDGHGPGDVVYPMIRVLRNGVVKDRVPARFYEHREIGWRKTDPHALPTPPGRPREVDTEPAPSTKASKGKAKAKDKAKGDQVQEPQPQTDAADVPGEGRELPYLADPKYFLD